MSTPTTPPTDGGPATALLRAKTYQDGWRKVRCKCGAGMIVRKETLYRAQWNRKRIRCYECQGATRAGIPAGRAVVTEKRAEPVGAAAGGEGG